jgi:spore coat polysaccharide biosynthesis predicted glycosyltransferase SpsG
LAAAGVIAYLGHHYDDDSEHLRTSLQRLTQTATTREGLAQASIALVDGLGVERVTQAMHTLERSIP